MKLPDRCGRDLYWRNVLHVHDLVDFLFLWRQKSWRRPWLGISESGLPSCELDVKNRRKCNPHHSPRRSAVQKILPLCHAFAPSDEGWSY